MTSSIDTTRNGHPISRQTLLGRAANRAMRELRRRHYPEYYQIYSAECAKLDLGRAKTPTQIAAESILKLTNEVNSLKAILAAHKIEVIEFEEDR